MIRFLIYLFESGVCLTLLFLVYFLFLRKETYFTFNRIYLLSILLLSFVLPLLHMNITLPGSQSVEERVSEIRNVKNYYERLISMTDPDYRNSFTKAFKLPDSVGFEESGQAFFPGKQTDNPLLSETNNIKTGFWGQINWARILLILYLLGTLFFTVRLLLLFRWLGQTVNKYGFTSSDGVKLVKMNEEVPPFSFFRFVFLHSETTSHSGFSQILAHEKAHIAQRHSIDLMLVHLLTIIQWFNPFAWLINKAMKTNHEYIADRNVVEQGYELFDYQSLLLKQMISIRSVELVNNFNLINIKKRITMMTKIKSGFMAQLKALVVIPAAMFVFFFFTEITVAQNQASPNNATENIDGLWERIGADAYGKLVFFEGNKLYILVDDGKYKEMEYSFAENGDQKNLEPFLKSLNSVKGKSSEIRLLKLKSTNPNVVFDVAFILRGDELIVDWDREHITRFKKQNSANSLDLLISKYAFPLDPVELDFYQISENPENNFFILLNREGEIMIDSKRTDFEHLPSAIKQVKSKGSPFSENEQIPILAIDAGCTMENVTALYHKLREMNELRYILSVSPKDKKVPEIYYHNIGIPRLLPPKEAKMLDEKEVEKSGMKIIRVDLTQPQCTPEWATSTFEKEIQKDKKFVVLLSYGNKTTYLQYVDILDKFYQDIYAKRDQLAHEKYNLGYNELAVAQQKEIRKSFPMVITEKNVDMPEE